MAMDKTTINIIIAFTIPMITAIIFMVLWIKAWAKSKAIEADVRWTIQDLRDAYQRALLRGNRLEETINHYGDIIISLMPEDEMAKRMVAINNALAQDFFHETLIERKPDLTPVEEVYVARDFSKTPGGRDGDFSGNLFRELHLEPNIKIGKVRVFLDGTYGYAHSFLRGAFEPLVEKFGLDKVLDRVELISEENPLLVDEIEGILKEAA